MTASAAPEPKTAHISNTAAWAAILRSQRRPLLVHLNGDTSWLIQLPYPSSANPNTAEDSCRSYFNILIDPWLQGPQSDVASWFSTQWHVVAPAVTTIADLQTALGEVEDGGCIDAVAISHEFTDHCHKSTLLEVPRDVPVYAADAAAKLIRGWKHFDTVVTTPGLAKGCEWTSLPADKLPSWLRIGRVVTAGNSLYYHSAIIVAFSQDATSTAEAVLYSPHGISSKDVAGFGSANNLHTLALLHGMHDVRIAMTKQLNLGALNAMEAVVASGAKYWVATHDEEKKGGGLIAPFLRRTRYSLAQAVKHQEKKSARKHEYCFKELDSGEAMLLQ